MTLPNARPLLARYHAAMSVVAAGKPELFWFAPGSGFERPGFVSISEHARRIAAALQGNATQRDAAQEVIERLEERMYERRQHSTLPGVIGKEEQDGKI